MDLDLAEIAERTGIDPRSLRYIVDHSLVAGKSIAGPGRGLPRTFTASKAFTIALSASLLQAGVRRRFAKSLAHGLTALRQRDSYLASEKPTAPATANNLWFLEFADGKAFRVRNVKPQESSQGNMPPWILMEDNKRMDATFQPLSILSINVTELAHRLRQA